MDALNKQGKVIGKGALIGAGVDDSELKAIGFIALGDSATVQIVPLAPDADLNPSDVDNLTIRTINGWAIEQK